MQLDQIKPLHFAFYKKKLPKQELLVELYHKDSFINDVNVLKTISQYSNRLCISHRTRDGLVLYTDKKCLKFKPKLKGCSSLAQLFAKLVDRPFLDCVFLRVEDIFYCCSRLNDFDYSVSLFYSIDNNYKDFTVENVFDSPRCLLGDFEFKIVKDKLNFKLEDLNSNLEEAGETETVAIEMPGERERQIVIRDFEEEGLLDGIKNLFRSNKSDRHHFITYGAGEGGRLLCKRKPLEPKEFKRPKELKKFLKQLIERVRISPIEYVEIDCEIQIFLIKNKGGLYLFSKYDVDKDCAKFVEAVHEVFVAATDL